ncbi:MAG TPA: hypothetical protein VMG60_24340 [Burkholderiaceae bacterium]|nr:hypothetical protein [Burkholderiaceae bacterium]
MDIDDIASMHAWTHGVVVEPGDVCERATVMRCARKDRAYRRRCAHAQGNLSLQGRDENDLIDLAA